MLRPPFLSRHDSNFSTQLIVLGEDARKSLEEVLKKEYAFHRADPDMRYNALKQTLAIFQQHRGKMDGKTQAKVREMLESHLRDQNGDVTEMAQKCLKELFPKFAMDQQQGMARTICTIMVDPEMGVVRGAGTAEYFKPECRDVLALSLKSILTEISDDGKFAVSIMNILLEGLAQAVKTGNREKNENILIYSLEVCELFLSRFGAEIADQHKALLEHLFQLLDHVRDGIRRSASGIIGILFEFIAQDLFEEFLQRLGNSSFTYKISAINALTQISKSAGIRLNSKVHLTFMVTTFCKELPTDKAGEGSEEQFDLWQNCLVALGSLIESCPLSLDDHYERILTTALKFIAYDPYYAYEDGAAAASSSSFATSAANDDEEDPFGDSAFDSSGGIGDWGAVGDWPTEDTTTNVSDDSSWKVRRAAATILEKVLTFRSSLVSQYFPEICSQLSRRLAERVIEVKVEIFRITERLIMTSVQKNLSAATSMKILGSGSAVSSSSMEQDGALAPPALVRQRSFFQPLVKATPDVVAKALAEMKTATDARVKRAVLSLLNTIVTLGEANGWSLLVQFLEEIVGHVCTVVESSKSPFDLLAFALTFSVNVATAHSVEELLPYLVPMASYALFVLDRSTSPSMMMNTHHAADVLWALADKIAGALLSPKGNASALHALSVKILTCVTTLLRKVDTTTELKLSLLRAAGHLCVQLGTSGKVDNEVQAVLACLPSHMASDNEVRRLQAVQAIATICVSWRGSRLLIAELGTQCLDMLLNILMQKSRAVTVHALRALTVLAKDSKDMDPARVLKPLFPLLTMQDAKLCELTLALVVALLERTGGSYADGTLLSDLVERLCTVLHSASSKTDALDERLAEACRAVTRVPKQNAFTLQSFFKLFYDMVLKQDLAQGEKKEQQPQQQHPLPGGSDINLLGIAKCLVCICADSADGMRFMTEQASQLLVGQQSAAHGPASKQLAMYVTGTLAASLDDAEHQEGKAGDRLMTACMDILQTGGVSNVMDSAAYAIGKLVTFSPPKAGYLSRILETMEKDQQATATYLPVLKALCMSVHDAKKPAVLTASLDRIFKSLVKCAGGTELHLPTQAAECLGRLLLADPVAALPLWDRCSASADASVRDMAVVALSLCFTAETLSNVALAELISPRVARMFADLPNDKVEHVVLQSMLNGLRQLLHCPTGVSMLCRLSCFGYQGEDAIRRVIVPAIYKELSPRQELIRHVKLGQTTITYDDGLHLRKSAYRCIEEVLRTADHLLDKMKLLEWLGVGHKDPDADVAKMASRLVETLSILHPAVVLEMADDLADNIFLPYVKKELYAVLREANEAKQNALKANTAPPAESENVQKVRTTSHTLMHTLVQLNKVKGICHRTKFHTVWLTLAVKSAHTKVIADAIIAGEVGGNKLHG